jgi:hypothetical protein
MMEQKLDPKATESALITAQAWFNSSDNLKTALANSAFFLNPTYLCHP